MNDRIVHINGKEVRIIELNDRLSYYIPLEGWPPQPHLYGLRKRLIKAGYNMCFQCGSTTNLQAHHLKPITYLKSAKGHYYQDPKADHSLDNGEMLCAPCHRRKHVDMRNTLKTS